MSKTLSIICLVFGGALGTLTRFYLGQKIANTFAFHPAISPITWVNILGCFIAGALLPLLPFLSEALKHLILIGFLGGLTTFSSFMLEALEIGVNTRFWLSLLQILLSNTLCFVSCFIGYMGTHILLKTITH